MLRRDGALLFTVRLRSLFGKTARVFDAQGALLTPISRDGRSWVAGQLTRLEEAATGVLSGPHGEIIAREEPVDGELVRFTFRTDDPHIRAALFGIFALYDYVSAR